MQNLNMSKYDSASSDYHTDTDYFFLVGLRCGVDGRPEFIPGYWYFAFFSDGFKICNKLSHLLFHFSAHLGLFKMPPHLQVYVQIHCCQHHKLKLISTCAAAASIRYGRTINAYTNFEKK